MASLTNKCHISAGPWLDTRRYKGKRVVRREVKDWLNKHFRKRWYLYIDKVVEDSEWPNVQKLNYYIVFEKKSDLVLFKLTWNGL